MLKKCFCGLPLSYEDCCGMFIESKNTPPSPEQLMRSRYSAYSQAKTDYIKDTMLGKALDGFDEYSAKQWAQSLIWLGLTVVSAFSESNEHGFVEFSAIFMYKNNKLQEIHELSEFKLIDEKWFYVDGKQLPPTNKFVNRVIPLNGLCPCGSGGKFKSCHNLHL